jgi:DNA-binding phage protein
MNPHTTKTSLADVLAGWLDEKCKQLKSFHLATERMKDALEKQDIKQIVHHAKERGRAMDRVKQIDKGIKEIAFKNKLTVDELYRSAKELLNPYLNKIRAVLVPLGDMDSRVLALAKADCATRKEELLKLRRKSEKAGGYRTGGTMRPRFLDIKK